MLTRADNHSGKVGNGKANERHWSAEGGDDGSKKSGDNQQQITHHGSVDTKIFRIALTKQYDVERLDKKQGTGKTCKCDSAEDWELTKRNTSETAHAPHEVGLYSLFGGEKVEKTDCRGGNIAYHDANDEQHDAVSHKN